MNKRWIGSTPRWADSRNVELKRTIRDKLRDVGRGIRIEHVHGHQDRRVKFEDLPLPAKLNVLCDKECERRVSQEPKTNPLKTL